MGQTIRKDLFGDSDSSDGADSNEEEDTEGADQDVSVEIKSKKRIGQHVEEEYEKFIDGQRDFEDPGGAKAPPKPLFEGLAVQDIDFSSSGAFDAEASELLFRLCSYADVKIAQVENMLKFGADPNYIPKGQKLNSNLHMLARRGVSPACVRRLLAAGADPHALNAYNQTPLMLGCDTVRTGDSLEIVRILCQQRKGLNLELRDSGGNSALMNSIFKSNPLICRELLLAGASATSGCPSAFEVALWVFSESLAQDVETLPPDTYQSSTCCFPWCPLADPALNYEGERQGSLRLLLQSFRMADYELVLRMVYYKKNLEHAFDDSRLRKNAVPISKTFQFAATDRGTNDKSLSAAGAGGVNRGHMEIATSSNGPSNEDEVGSKSDRLKHERNRRIEKRNARKAQKVANRRAEKEMEERNRLDRVYLDHKQHIEMTYAHTVAPKKKDGTDIWRRAPTSGKWSRPEEDENHAVVYE